MRVIVTLIGMRSRSYRKLSVVLQKRTNGKAGKPKTFTYLFHVHSSSKECLSLTLIMDCTERLINHSKGKDERKEHYSGKRRGLRSRIMWPVSEAERCCTWVTRTRARSMTNCFVTRKITGFWKGASCRRTRGFRGINRRGRNLSTPKETANGELNQSEKERNREISQQRVKVEHQIGGIKRCNIVMHPLRTRTDHFTDTSMEVTCGLHNLQLSHRQLKLSNWSRGGSDTVFMQTLLVSD